MDERLSDLLRIVVEEYVAAAEPVGSQHLVSRYRLEVSPATVRNWFSELEEGGYLTQPHTSGGRIPTEKGYRTYIERFVRPKPAAKRERDALQKTAEAAADGERQWKSVAKHLAELSGLALIVGLNEADTFYTGLSQLFSQPEFKDWQRMVSMTEVLDRLDETLNTLRRQKLQGAQILIGRECPFGPGCGSVVISTDDGLIGILGPLRMDYQYALSLMTSVSEVLKNL